MDEETTAWCCKMRTSARGDKRRSLAKYLSTSFDNPEGLNLPAKLISTVTLWFNNLTARLKVRLSSGKVECGATRVMQRVTLADEISSWMREIVASSEDQSKKFNPQRKLPVGRRGLYGPSPKKRT